MVQLALCDVPALARFANDGVVAHAISVVPDVGPVRLSEPVGFALNLKPTSMPPEVVEVLFWLNTLSASTVACCWS